jgi:uncharacterized protein (DUF433 family)
MVSVILDNLADGLIVEQIVANYPGLTTCPTCPWPPRQKR